MLPAYELMNMLLAFNNPGLRRRPLADKLLLAITQVVVNIRMWNRPSRIRSTAQNRFCANQKFAACLISTSVSYGLFAQPARIAYFYE